MRACRDSDKVAIERCGVFGLAQAGCGTEAERACVYSAERVRLLWAVWDSSSENALSDPATRTAADGDSQDEVFGMNDSDVNQNKNRSNKSETTSSPAPAIHPSAGQTNQAMGYWPRPHLVRLFSRDAPGREDNTFKERPSESDELHTIEEAEGATSENSE
ncbi:hypothetical protein HF521_010377 [Silurus meridionalis]|uniref:Myelin basic protein n=1 Tax=Silurus meridionalis TaxID=175797 RepID=A0A8T0AM10_SILME|nr:hypothetical protein HF521_010377 [Silurus meridionalis]